MPQKLPSDALISIPIHLKDLLVTTNNQKEVLIGWTNLTYTKDGIRCWMYNKASIPSSIP